MEYRTFGRTGLRVSIAGLGAGGASRLGLAYGSTDDDAIAVIRRAIELGINYFDTAENYETEEVVGRGLKGHRDKIVLSSKVGPHLADGSLRSGAELRDAVELALTKLGTDVIDVYHLHRVFLKDYDYCVAELVPVLAAMRDEGKIRFIGLSEATSTDAGHSMLRRAVTDDCWDVAMVGFTLFNQSARESVLPTAQQNGIAIEIMAAARSEFSQPERLAEELNRLAAAGSIDASAIDPDDPVAFVTEGVASLTDVSYRYAAHEPGVHVVLVGTGKIPHLEENVASLTSGPLPEVLRQRLTETFGHLSETVYVPGRHASP